MKKYSTLFLLLLCLGLVIIIFTIRSNAKQTLQDLNVELSQTKFQFEKTQNLFLHHLALERNEFRWDSIKPLFLEKNIPADRKKLVVRIFRENCKECIIKIFGVLNRYKNIVVLSNYDNQREINFLMKELNVNFPVINKVRLFANEPTLSPYLFVVNGDKIEDIFIPNEDLPELMEKYLKFINKP